MIEVRSGTVAQTKVCMKNGGTATKTIPILRICTMDMLYYYICKRKNCPQYDFQVEMNERKRERERLNENMN